MKYCYVGGPYKEFMGRQFAFGKPVEILDRATLKALEGRRDFAAYIETKQEEPSHAVRQEEKKEVVNPDACQKCGRIVKRGRYIHEKYCKGVP